MSDTVSILGELDFGRPRRASPPAAALAGNQLLFMGNDSPLKTQLAAQTHKVG